MKFIMFFLFSTIVIAQDSLNCKLFTIIETPSNAYCVDVQENLLITGSFMLNIMDISDLDSPKLLYSDSLSSINEIKIIDSTAFICGAAGLNIYDISTPSNPKLMSFYESGDYFETILIDEDIIYIGTLNYKFLILDISDLENPIEISGYDYQIDDVWGMDKSGDLLFVASEDTGLKIFDVANPNNIELLSTTNLPTLVGVRVVDSIAYAIHPSRFFAYNISDPANPVYLDSLHHHGGVGFVIEDNYAYCNGFDGLKIIDISNPEDLKLVGKYGLPGTGNDLYVKNKFVYMPFQSKNLYLIEFDETISGFKEEFNPFQFSLYQNYPNPFNPATTIQYSIPENAFVSLKIYDLLGREISSLVNGYLPSGNHTIDFNAGNLTSGIYFYQLKTNNYSHTRKMMLLK